MTALLSPKAAEEYLRALHHEVQVNPMAVSGLKGKLKYAEHEANIDWSSLTITEMKTFSDNIMQLRRDIRQSYLFKR
jgi:hypothetical protein